MLYILQRKPEFIRKADSKRFLNASIYDSLKLTAISNRNGIIDTIEAMGTRYGVVRRQLSEGTWTDWLKIPYITYIEETEEPPPTEPIETEVPLQ